MKKVLVVLALLGATVALAKGKPIFPYPLKVTTLKNGLTLTLVADKTISPGLVAYYSSVRVGSRNEVEAGLSGFAHFFEHVMFKGTKTWPTGTRDALLGKLGFSENAFTSDDITVYHINGPANQLEKLMELEADRFRNLEYTEETFQTEAKAVLGEYHKNAASPGLKIEEAIIAQAFKKHTYQHTTLGFYDDVKAMPTRYEYSKQFFKRWYTPDNVMIFVVGDFDEKTVIAWAEKYYGSWAGKAATIEVPVEPEQTAPLTASVEWTTPTLPRAGQYFRVPASSLKTKDGATMQVLTAYLAGSTSPLYKKLVLDEQLVDGVRADWGDHRDPTLFGISASLKDEKNRAAVDAAITAAIKDLQSKPADAKRVQDIKDNLKYGLLMGLETVDDIAGSLAYIGGVLGAPDALDTGYQNLAAVTAADLTAFAKKHLTDNHRTTLVFTVKLAKEGAK